MKKINSKTVVFVTGAFVSHHGWNNWRSYFESEGYICLVPAWPYKEGSPEELRKKHPYQSALKELRLEQLIDHFVRLIEALPEKPILIGHSTGGLVVQLLLQRGLGAAGIVVHSVPAQGVLSFRYSFIKSLWGPLGLFSTTNKTFLMSLEQWQYAFTNGMSYEEQKCTYYENVIPESKKLIRDCLSSVARVDFTRPHAPLLFISGSTDHIMPASLNYSNYKRYKNTDSITEYKEFEGKNHFVLGLPSWKDEAEFSRNWIHSYS
ncbi:MAG: alpha/beta hydrolase [Sediminicola sp.]